MGRLRFLINSFLTYQKKIFNSSLVLNFCVLNQVHFRDCILDHHTKRVSEACDYGNERSRHLKLNSRCGCVYFWMSLQKKEVWILSVENWKFHLVLVLVGLVTGFDGFPFNVESYIDIFSKSVWLSLSLSSSSDLSSVMHMMSCADVYVKSVWRQL